MKYNYKEFNKDSKLTPIIILHGWGGSLNSLNPLAENLSKSVKNRIFNLELSGFGSTPVSKDVMNTSDYANFVYDFLKEKNIKKYILVGHSFGGKTSIALTLKHSEMIEKLILVNSSGIKPKNSAKRKFFKVLISLVPTKVKDIGFLKKIFYKKIVRENDYLNSGKLSKSLSKIVSEHFDKELNHIQTPTLIIWSEKDKAVPLWMGEFLNSEIKTSKFIVVKDKTHGLPLTNPEIVSDIITEFLN
ncbi:alpha/beta hydrolase [Candidatus Dojkabacteria bacterium]|nr:alpha/beta hydrolase [Candidatus Dojkabacteria bacterium]